MNRPMRLMLLAALASCGVAASAVNARLRRPKANGRMKRKRFHAILQQQSNIRENTLELPHELLGFELVFVERIGSGLGAGFGVIALVG